MVATKFARAGIYHNICLRGYNVAKIYAFCSRCGANLFGGGWPDTDRASVRVTTLDEPPAGAKITRHGYVRSTAPWEILPDDGADRFE